MRSNPAAARRLVPVMLLLAAAACAAGHPSRKWHVPPTPEAERCAADCAETRTLCVRRPTRAEVAQDRTRRNEGEGYVFLGYDDDVLRQQRCDAVFEDCVGLCPGVTPR